MSDLAAWLLNVLLILVAGLLLANLLSKKERRLTMRMSATIFRRDGTRETINLGKVSSDDTEYLGTHRLDLDQTVEAVKIHARADYT